LTDNRFDTFEKKNAVGLVKDSAREVNTDFISLIEKKIHKIRGIFIEYFQDKTNLNFVAEVIYHDGYTERAIGCVS
jgi:hypothetical protein